MNVRARRAAAKLMKELVDGETYQNMRGDFRGPMEARAGYFLDQYGEVYSANGIVIGHTPRSTANINFSTAGTQEGWRDESAYVRPAQSDTHRMAETGTGSGRSPTSAVGEADAPNLQGQPQ
jgi:hypothetical protein